MERFPSKGVHRFMVLTWGFQSWFCCCVALSWSATSLCLVWEMRNKNSCATEGSVGIKHLQRASPRAWLSGSLNISSYHYYRYYYHCNYCYQQHHAASTWPGGSLASGPLWGLPGDCLQSRGGGAPLFQPPGPPRTRNNGPPGNNGSDSAPGAH